MHTEKNTTAMAEKGNLSLASRAVLVPYSFYAMPVPQVANHA